MDPTHDDDAALLTSHILDMLTKRFPLATNFTVTEIAMGVGLRVKYLTTKSRHRDSIEVENLPSGASVAQMAGDVLDWLAREGLVHTTGGMTGVVLSQKGLTQLGVRPPCVSRLHVDRRKSARDRGFLD